ncbi:ERG4/ERG24 ergosterol biosynthesis protein [Atractiella rhizophila]|nr:ERG4/ERG24 ergosterol biosynthesis protein [Atractiella rhizophila]
MGGKKASTTKDDPKTSKPVDRMDLHEYYEFGGPIGTFAMMTVFPVLMYYFWICLYFNDGKLAMPLKGESVGDAVLRWWGLLQEHAAPTGRAFQLYGGLMVYQIVLAFIMPGYKQEGLPVTSLGGRTLMYNCNALPCLYATCVTTAALHYFDIVHLAELIDRFGELMTVSMIFGFGVAAFFYIFTIARGEQVRMSGNLIYDYFMGAALNPRIGSVDVKMWCEVRIPWVLMFLMSLAGASKQYDLYGYVSPNQAFMCLATGLYINACAKGEECIPQTWDMVHEKFGWLLSFWNLSGVPFMYTYSIVYMATHNPEVYRFSTSTYVLLYTTLMVAHIIFDTSMAQKSKFKAQQTGTYQPRYAFPQWPGSIVKNPTFIQTKRGSKLLTGGWWAYLRKPNYSADSVQLATWALCSGFGSILPYWLPFFFFAMLIHRCSRDFERCSKKYGEDWDRYCKVVPYRFIPYVY